MIPAAAKALARRTLASPAPYALLRAWARRRGGVAILCYHTLGADDETMDAWTVLRVADFRAQLDALRAERDIVSLDAALAADDAARRPLAVLTFDDGEAGLHRHLLPIVEAERIPVTLYVATGQIEAGRPYWFDRAMNALQAPGPFAIDLADHGLGRRVFGTRRGPARWAAISDLLEVFKRMPPEAREAATETIVARAPAAEGFTPLAPLTRAELAELAGHPLVTIGAHSHGHELLDRIPAAKARASMERSRTALEAWTGRAVHHFAYPNGNHDAAVRTMAATAGFVTGAALGQRMHHPGDDRLVLPRFAIGRYDDTDRLRLRLVGV